MTRKRPEWGAGPNAGCLRKSGPGGENLTGKGLKEKMWGVFEK